MHAGLRVVAAAVSSGRIHFSRLLPPGSARVSSRAAGATTSRRRGLFLDLLTSCSSNETKIVSARRGNQHARRARYPEPLLLNYVAALAWLRCGMQYSSPLRATRNSRFGSLTSVAPQIAHRCKASTSASRVCISNRRRRVVTSRR